MAGDIDVTSFHAVDGEPPVDEMSSKSSKRKDVTGSFIEWIIVIIVAAVMAFSVRTWAYQSFLVPSASMEPTLIPGDRIAVNKVVYHLHDIRRGDIIVFHRPPLENCGSTPVTYLVKRVVAVGGDSISFRNGSILLNGKVMPEPWFTTVPPLGYDPTAPEQGNEPWNKNPYVVPKGDVYVMGDNRAISCDSRYWGPVQQSLIVGRVDGIVWPLSRFSWF